MTLAGIRRYTTARGWAAVSVPFFRSRPRQVRALFKQARTDTPLGTIASLCDWGSDVSLQRFFRSRTGMTMREWRARNRG